LSKVKVFEAKLGGQGQEQVRERITPELYLFSPVGELKLRALGYEERTFGDVIEVLTSDRTLYMELSAEQLERKIDELQTEAAKNLKFHLKEKQQDMSRSMFGKMVNNQNKEIERVFKLPLLTETEIAKHIQNTDISAEKLSILSNDMESYLLVTYSADWCEPCHTLSKQLLTYFKEREDSIKVNWVKLNR
jgi:hypothetical protein